MYDQFLLHIYIPYDDFYLRVLTFDISADLV